jgi:hypothetical protein
MQLLNKNQGPIIEIVSDPLSPQSDDARRVVVAALGLLGMPLEWYELDPHDTACPDYARACTAPTVFINGRDISPSLRSGYTPNSGSFVREVPSLKQVVRALIEETRTPRPAARTPMILPASRSGKAPREERP